MVCHTLSFNPNIENREPPQIMQIEKALLNICADNDLIKKGLAFHELKYFSSFRCLFHAKLNFNAKLFLLFSIMGEGLLPDPWFQFYDIWIRGYSKKKTSKL